MSKLRDHIKTFDYTELVGFSYPGEWQMLDLEDKILKNHISKTIVAKYIFEFEGETYAVEMENPGLKSSYFNWRSLRRVVPEVIDSPKEPFTVYNEVDP